MVANAGPCKPGVSDLPVGASAHGPATERLPKRPRRPIVSRMANQSAQLSDVFYALADPTRRAIVGALGKGPASVSALAAPFAMALPSFMKHVSVLERSGLVR